MAPLFHVVRLLGSVGRTGRHAVSYPCSPPAVCTWYTVFQKKWLGNKEQLGVI